MYRALCALSLSLFPLCAGYHQEQLWTGPRERGAKPSTAGYETQPAPWQLPGQTAVCDSMTTKLRNGECVSSRCPQACMCSLTVWNCDNRGLTEIPTEFPDTLLNLFLRGNTISRIDDAAFKDLPNLEVIDISENNITVIHHRAFQELPRLKRLILRGNPQLQDLQPSVFHDLPMLSIIRLDSCNITTLSPGRFTKLPMLKELDFSHNAVRMRGARAGGGVGRGLVGGEDVLWRRRWWFVVLLQRTGVPWSVALGERVVMCEGAVWMATTGILGVRVRGEVCVCRVVARLRCHCVGGTQGMTDCVLTHVCNVHVL